MRRRDLFRPRPRDDLRQRDELDVRWLEVVVLGLVQGLTEFLPISSSAHLRIVSEVFFGRDAGAAFTAVTQLGTEAAVLIYFARDIARLTLGLGARPRPAGRPALDPDYRLAWLVILGTLPIGVLGLAFEDQIQTAARNLWLIATTLVVFGVLLGVAERVGRQKVDLERMTVGQGLTLGSCAGDGAGPGRVPLRGHDHRGALPRAHPARGRAVLVPARDPGRRGVRDLPAARTSTPGGPSGLQMVVATLIAFAVGYAAIAWLLRYVEHHSVYLFVWYRFALGRGAVRRARCGVDLGDLIGGAPRSTIRLADRDHPDPPAPRAVVGERGRRAGGPHPRRRAGRDGPCAGRAGGRAARRGSARRGRELTGAALRADRRAAARRARARPASPSRGWPRSTTGRGRVGELKELSKEPLWRVVQAHPSAAVFPDGEGLAGMQARAVAAVRRHDARIAAEHGPRAVWLACSHGDVIKSVLADALACHLDNFQRIVVDPCSISVVHYTETRPFVVRVNDLGGDVADLVPPGAEAGGGGRAGDVGRRRREARAGTLTIRFREGCRPAGRRSTLGEVMSRVIHVFRQPERFVAGTVGEPGDRSFYLQAIQDARTVSVLLEKQQVTVLAERITALLQEVARRFGSDVPAGAERTGRGPLAVPLEEEFRVGTMGLGWDADSRSIVVELLAVTEEEVDESVVLDDTEEGPGRVARVPVPDAGSRFRRACGEGGIGRAPAMPAVRRAAGPGGSRLRSAERVPPADRDHRLISHPVDPARPGRPGPAAPGAYRHHRTACRRLERHVVRHAERGRCGAALRVQARARGAAAVGLSGWDARWAGSGELPRLRGRRLARRAADGVARGAVRAGDGAGLGRHRRRA